MSERTVTPQDLRSAYETLSRRIATLETALERTRELRRYLDSIATGAPAGEAARQPAPAPTARTPRRRRRAVGITIEAAVRQALAGGKSLTRRELQDVLEGQPVKFTPASLQSAVSQLKKRGVLAAAPTGGRGDAYHLA